MPRFLAGILLVVALFGIPTYTLISQTIVTNRVVSPQEKARKMRADFGLTSEQENQFIELYQKANAIRAEINANPVMEQEKRLAKYAEWRALLNDGRRRILTDEQFSDYMARVQGEKDRLDDQGMTIEEIREDYARKHATPEIKATPTPASSNEQRKLHSAFETSPLENSFAFSRLQFDFTGRFTFAYQEQKTLDRLAVDVRVKGVNTGKKRETVLVSLKRIICERVTTTADPASGISRGGKYTHTYQFHLTDEAIPSGGQQYFDSNFFRDMDCITVTISQPVNLPVGGKDQGLDYALYDRERARQLWESWPNPDNKNSGAVSVAGIHATTGDQVTLINRPFGPNTWSVFARDPDRRPGKDEPLLVAEKQPHLDFNCDYLLSSPQYKLVAFPELPHPK